MTTWPKNQYGKFFNGDSYIILNVSNININAIERKRVLEQACRLSHLSVHPPLRLSVVLSGWWVNCEKTADWIWMSFVREPIELSFGW